MLFQMWAVVKKEEQDSSLIMLLKMIFWPNLKRNCSIPTKPQHMVAFSNITEGGLYFIIDW